VTGASEGIGEAFAKHLDKRQTHNIVLVARTKAKLEKVASTFKYVQSKILVEDLSTPGSAEKVFEKTKVSSEGDYHFVHISQDLRVSLLINNAGIAPGGNHEELDFATIQRVSWFPREGKGHPVLTKLSSTNPISSYITYPQTIALNITVLTELMSLFLPFIKKEHEKLREKRKSSKFALSGIINVSSMSAFMPIPSMALYAATKVRHGWRKWWLLY
jgi:short-subunit dehydrogenase